MNRKNNCIVLLIGDFLQIGGFCSISIGSTWPKLLIFHSNSRFRDAMQHHKFTVRQHHYKVWCN